MQEFKRTLSLILVVIMVLPMFSSVTFAEDDMSPLQKIIIQGLDLDKNNRIGLTNAIDEFTEYPTKKDSVVKEIKSKYLLNLSTEDIGDALDAFLGIPSNEVKNVLINTIKQPLPSISNSSGFTNIRAKLNKDIANDSTNDNGLRFIVSILKQISEMLPDIIVGDSVNNEYLIHLNRLTKYTRYTALTDSIFEIIQTLPFDDKTFEGFMTYYESYINSCSYEEIKQFKLSLGKNNIYFGNAANMVIPTATATKTVEPTNTAIPTATKTAEPTNTAMPTATKTLEPTNASMPTATKTAEPTNTAMPTATKTAEPTSTAMPTATKTAEPTSTAMPTATKTAEPTNTAMPTATKTLEPTNAAMPTATKTAEPTNTAMPTATKTAEPTSTAMPTATKTAEPTSTAMPTATKTAEPTSTAIPTATKTAEPTSTAMPTATKTAEPTSTAIPTATKTAEPTSTAMPKATKTAEPASTAMPTATNTVIPTNTTNTVTPTVENGPTATSTVTPTPTKKKSKGGRGGFLKVDTPTVTPTQTPISIAEEIDENIPAGSVVLTDIKDHWSENFINSLVSKKIINGYPDNTFKPNNCITRAEAAALIVKMLGLSEAQDKTLSFADSNEISGWAKGYIKTALEKGFVTGYNDNTFRSSNQITRAEMAVMIIRALKKEKGNEAAITFADADKIQRWAKGYIAKACELKFVDGYGDNTFKPLKSITRAEVSVIVSKALNEIKR